MDDLKWKNLNGKERVALIAILAGVSIVFLAGGLRLPGDSGAPPVTAAPDTAAFTRTATAPPREYNGLREGDTVPNGDITHYCACRECCGKWADIKPRKTADGTLLDGLALPGAEKIASCNWLPFDSVVEVEGVQYRIADRGGRGLSTIGRLDVFEPRGHAAALQRVRVKDVQIHIVSLADAH